MRALHHAESKRRACIHFRIERDNNVAMRSDDYSGRRPFAACRCRREFHGTEEELHSHAVGITGKRLSETIDFYRRERILKTLSHPLNASIHGRSCRTGARALLLLLAIARHRSGGRGLDTRAYVMPMVRRQQHQLRPRAAPWCLSTLKRFYVGHRNLN